MLKHFYQRSHNKQEEKTKANRRELHEIAVGSSEGSMNDPLEKR